MVSLSGEGRVVLVDSSHASEHKQKSRLSHMLRRIVPALLLLGLWAPAGFAADIVVMTAEDRLDSSFATFDFSLTADPTNSCGTVVDAAAFPAEPSLREALIYANHMPGPDTITFAPELSGQTIMVSFDGSDEGEEADFLPTLCGGDITLNGDIDGDGTPDITLDGSSLATGIAFGLFADSDNNTITGLTLQNFLDISIYTVSGSRTTAATGNRITNNTTVGGLIGIGVFSGVTMAGTTADSTVSGNTISGTTYAGIEIAIAYTGSSIDGTQVTDNVIRNSDGGGIITNMRPFVGGTPEDTSITNTTIQGNEVSENAWAGMVARFFTTNNSTITGLRILENHAFDNGGGISIEGGRCGATGNTLEAEIARNTLSGSGTGIGVQGGSNSFCGSEDLSPASQNNVTVTITDNVSEDARWNGISIEGGVRDANNNTVTATLTGNTLLGGNHGLRIRGGEANYTDAEGMEVTTAVANGNTVTATLTNNRLEGAMYAELDVTAGGHGSASDNTVDVTIENNIVCGSRDSLWGQGGQTNDENPFWANAGTGNTLTVSLTDNSAGKVNVVDGVAGNTAMLTESGTRSCGRVLENPRDYSPQSGIGVISGWACEAEEITIEFENGVTGEVSIMPAGYGTSRPDTAEVCEDDGNNGFGLLYNWSRLGDGMHTVRALVDGVEFGLSSVMVSTLGGEFVTGLSGTYPLADFPLMGVTTTIQWEQSLQNFVIASGAGGGGGSAGAIPQILENPRPGSFQSGIGVISGWVCEAEEITIEFENGVTGEVSSTMASYGTSRPDTAEVCEDDGNNGFGLLHNWNRLGAGTHTVRALADGVEFAQSTFTVSTLGGEFVTGLGGEFSLTDFPSTGQVTSIEWEESLQNFVITGVE